MGSPHQPDKVKLIAGLLLSEGFDYGRVYEALEEAFGPMDFTSDMRPWEHTAYYESEMGPHLRRLFVSFAHPIFPGDLVHAKLECNAMEERLSGGPKRRVNIDPGTLSLSNLILASTKNHAHRIYLSDGIYGEVTLIYREGAYRTLPWTYPDYAEAVDVFARIRDLWKRQQAGNT